VAWITSETTSPTQAFLKIPIFKSAKTRYIALILTFLPVTPYPVSPDNFFYPVSPEDKTAKNIVFVIFSGNFPDIS